MSSPRSAPRSSTTYSEYSGQRILKQRCEWLEIKLERSERTRISAQKVLESAHRRADHESRTRGIAEAQLHGYIAMYGALRDRHDDLIHRERDALSRARGAESRLWALEGRFRSQEEQHRSECARIKAQHKAELESLTKQKRHPRTTFRTDLMTRNDWFLRYEKGWRDIMVANGSETRMLDFCDVPWPAFKAIHSAKDLDETDIMEFFSAKYPGALGFSWKEEFLRWHPDRISRLTSLLKPQSINDVAITCERCVRTMVTFQMKKNGG